MPCWGVFLESKLAPAIYRLARITECDQARQGNACTKLGQVSRGVTWIETLPVQEDGSGGRSKERLPG